MDYLIKNPITQFGNKAQTIETLLTSLGIFGDFLSEVDDNL
ncbi:MAG: hypothetical protein AAGJ08_02840 [Cyanobacteria bacterium P01_H01_bin.35]